MKSSHSSFFTGFRIGLMALVCGSFLFSMWFWFLVFTIFALIFSPHSEYAGMLISGGGPIHLFNNVMFSQILYAVRLLELFPFALVYGIVVSILFSIIRGRKVFTISVIGSGILISLVIIAVQDSYTYFSTLKNGIFWLSPGVTGASFVAYFYTRKHLS